MSTHADPDHDMQSCAQCQEILCKKGDPQSAAVFSPADDDEEVEKFEVDVSQEIDDYDDSKRDPDAVTPVFIAQKEELCAKHGSRSHCYVCMWLSANELTGCTDDESSQVMVMD
jgi:hypothetical protein